MVSCLFTLIMQIYAKIVPSFVCRQVFIAHWLTLTYSVQLSLSVRPYIPATGFWPPSATVVSTKPFSHGTGTLFAMYTTPLCTLVSSFSLNHHLYADDTQLFLSFHPSDFHYNISHLQNALQQISSWMTTINLLTLNSSKTEFLLIGLKQQLSNIQDSSLATTHSARSLGFIFDEHPYFDFKTASTIATSIVHKINYCNSPYHNLLNCQLNWLQQIQNSLARAVLKAPKSTQQQQQQIYFQ